MGLKSAQWISVTPGQYNAIPKGLDYYPNGIFLQNNQTGEIDQIVGRAAALGLGPGHGRHRPDQHQIATIGADQFNAIPLGDNFVAPAPTANTQNQSGNGANG